jgi:hypothetical protein
MEVHGQQHASAALLMGMVPMVVLEYERYVDCGIGLNALD